MTFPGLPGRPTLTVVGLAASVSENTEGWVAPAEIPVLTAPGNAPAPQMLYRFAHAATSAQVTADRAAIGAAVPPDAMTGATSYLTVKLAADKNSATFTPFVVAFGLLGLFMSILVIAIVVSGAVSSATRRIGILKSLGFTPSQVARGYVGQALIPAAFGTGSGVVLGNLLAIPVIHTEATALGAATAPISPWLDLLVAAVALAAVAVTALVPALRAARLRTVEAIAVGRGSRAGRGRAVQRLLGRLPLPRAVSLGLAGPVSRPGRATTILAAVMLGAIGVTFGVGLAISLNGIAGGMSRAEGSGAVVVPDLPLVPRAGARTADPGAIAAKIGAQPGTRRYFSTARTQVDVAGLAGMTPVIAYQGDSSWGAYQMVAGSWFSRRGQAVVPSGFLTATGTRIGDTVTLTADGHRAPVRIVGEVFDLQDDGMVILTDRSSLAGLGVDLPAASVQFDIDLRPGTGVAAYTTGLDAALRPLGVITMPAWNRLNPTILAMDALAAMLTVMLVVVAGLGVLNTVVLDTRERVHDLGVFKALGMSPRQTIGMVVTSVAGIGLLAGAIGVPIGIVLHDYVLPVMGRAAGTRIPGVDLAVYQLPVLVPLVLGGLVIATAGALLPAGWAARTRTATALRTE